MSPARKGTVRRGRFDVFCREAFDFLDAAGVRHLEIGGLAVVAVGEPRITADAEVIAYASTAQARDLIARAIAAGFEAELEIEERRLVETGTLRFGKGPFGRMVALPTAEDLLVLKILAGRAKDMVDAIGIARRHAGRLDRAYVEAQLREICDVVEDMAPWARLERVFDEAKAQG